MTEQAELQTVERTMAEEDASCSGVAGGGASEWQTLRDAGNALFDSGHLSQAAAKYGDALVFISLANRPARVHLLNNRALAHLRAGKPRLAIWDCESVLLLAPPPTRDAANFQHRGNPAMLKAIYIKAMGQKERGDVEAARMGLHMVWLLSGTRQELLSPPDRTHVQELLVDLAKHFDADIFPENDGPGIVPRVGRTLQRVSIWVGSHLLWSLAPLCILIGAWIHVAVMVNVTADGSRAMLQGSMSPALVLDLERARVLSLLGTLGITILWHIWGLWEVWEKKRRGVAFRSSRDHVRAWWALSRSLGLQTCMSLLWQTFKLSARQAVSGIFAGKECGQSAVCDKAGEEAAQSEQIGARQALKRDVDELAAALQGQQQVQPHSGVATENDDSVGAMPKSVAGGGETLRTTDRNEGVIEGGWKKEGGKWTKVEEEDTEGPDAGAFGRKGQDRPAPVDVGGKREQTHRPGEPDRDWKAVKKELDASEMRALCADVVEAAQKMIPDVQGVAPVEGVKQQDPDSAIARAAEASMAKGTRSEAVTEKQTQEHLGMDPKLSLCRKNNVPSREDKDSDKRKALEEIAALTKMVSEANRGISQAKDQLKSENASMTAHQANLFNQPQPQQDATTSTAAAPPNPPSLRLDDNEVADTGDRMFEGNLLREMGNAAYKQALAAPHTAVRKRRLQEAVDLYWQAHNMDPDSVTALTNLAAAHMALGEHGKAVRDCDLAVSTATRVRADKKLAAKAELRKAKALRALDKLPEALVAVVESERLAPCEEGALLADEVRRALETAAAVAGQQSEKKCQSGSAPSAEEHGMGDSRGQAGRVDDDDDSIPFQPISDSESEHDEDGPLASGIMPSLKMKDMGSRFDWIEEEEDAKEVYIETTAKTAPKDGSPDKKSDSGGVLKEKGNAHFKKKEYSEAKTLYLQALSSPDVQSGDALWTSLSLNLAACCNRLEEAGADGSEAEIGVRLCSEVLERDKENAKAYYRRAQARLLMGDVDKALSDSLCAQAIEPFDKAINTLCQKLQEERNRACQNDKTVIGAGGDPGRSFVSQKQEETASNFHNGCVSVGERSAVEAQTAWQEREEKWEKEDDDDSMMCMNVSDSDGAEGEEEEGDDDGQAWVGSSTSGVHDVGGRAVSANASDEDSSAEEEDTAIEGLSRVVGEDSEASMRSAVAIAESYKAEGNNKFKQQCYSDALDCYAEGLDVLQRPSVDSELPSVKRLGSTLKLNIAASALRQSQGMARDREAICALDKVMRHSNAVLAQTGDEVQRAKAFLRRGQALSEAASLDAEARARSVQMSNAESVEELVRAAREDLLCARQFAAGSAGGDTTLVDSALEDLESGGVEKRRQRLRAKLKPAVRPAQASKARGSVGLEGNGHVRSVKPRGFHEWSEVDVDAELERLDTESLVEQGLTQQEITNKKILEIVQDETLEEDEKMLQCMRLAGHPNWTPPPLSAEDKARREQESLMRFLQDPRRQLDEKASFLSNFYAEHKETLPHAKEDTR